MTGIVVSQCAGCGWKGLPERLWCPHCGSAEVGTVAVSEGTLEERTVARRAGDPARPVHVASVRIDGGGSLIVRLEGELATGAAVELDEPAGVPVARAAGGDRG